MREQQRQTACPGPRKESGIRETNKQVKLIAMSLQTDIIFVAAIKSDASILGQLKAGDVYNTTIALPDEDLDNAPVPYCIVSQGEVVNDGTTKDDYEGDTDTVKITVEVAARTRAELGTLADKIRKAVRRYFIASEEGDEGHDMVPLDYQFSASPVNYDPLKPCYWMELIYQCDVNNNTTEDYEQD